MEVHKASGDGRQNSGSSQNIQRQRENQNFGNWGDVGYLWTSTVWEGFVPALKIAESEMQGRCLFTAPSPQTTVQRGFYVLYPIPGFSDVSNGWSTR